MRFYLVFQIVLCVVSSNFVNATSSEETADLKESCCSHGETFALTASRADACAGAEPPDEMEVEPKYMDICRAEINSCCKKYFQLKDDCSAGIKLGAPKLCSVPKTEIGKTCCEECSLGRWTGESQGKEACGSPADGFASSATTALRKNAYYQCCVEAAEKPITTEKPPETTTVKKIVRETCKKNSCAHVCDDSDGKVRCSCREGYRLQGDKKSCKDINECAEALDDLCTAEGTVCHNTPGSFKCVPIRKREVGHCPPGFKRNVVNQVCDDINECQLPRPPCPKYLCENTIGGYKCAGKPGKPFEEAVPGVSTEPSASTTPVLRNDICPTGFRAGPDDDCIDINECDETLDDCQRLSQHCINTHGSYFCQDHVSKRCAPGFKVNAGTGVCEDIDECEESTEVCGRTEVCVNMPGAYTCKSKSSTLPKYNPNPKSCQEGTKMRPGGTVCEDIDECRQGTHLCDEFQNCINTYGGHECRCKNGFELDPSGSCVDIDECALKLDNCREGTHCLNVLGSFACTRRPPSTPTTTTSRTTTTTTTTTTPQPVYEYEYYDSEEDNSTTTNETEPSATTSTTTTPSPPIPPPPPLPPRPTYPTRTTTTRRTRPYEIPTTSYERPTSPRRPYIPPTRTTPTRPVEVTVPTPTDTVTMETERGPDGSYGEDTGNIPKDTWTNVVGTDRTGRPSRPERPESRSERPSSPEVPSRPEEFPEREKPVWPERPSRPERPDSRPERPSRPESSSERPNERPIRPKSRPESPSRPERPDSRPERPSRPESRPGRPGSRPERPSRPEDFDLESMHCLNGFERNEHGECVDINECEQNKHICTSLEVCQNRRGGYVCECMPGYRRSASGWCTPIPIPTTTERITTERTTTAITTYTDWSPFPTRPTTSGPRRPFAPMFCDIGYTFDPSQGKCVDIDECATNKANCAPNEQCVNIDGGYRCECGRNCQPEPYRPSYVIPPRDPSPNTNVITVGAQYGQRGGRYMRAKVSRLPDSAGMPYTHSCPWGYKLTPDKMCLDIDECTMNVSECGPRQRCENFFGGYSCQCPAGHQLVGQDCQDIDECTYGRPCPYNSECINTVGSYKCSCGEGFRNAPSNEKVCVDIDECTETPSVCEHACANAWGGYRCYCKRGYRLHTDNRTCIDVDECAEWTAVRTRGRLCGGDCVNEPGSYRCSCPSGYRLSEDSRSCIDIDECETGQASCARGAPGEVCQNTRGGYHCHTIQCPRGYRLDNKHRCSRIQRSCHIGDWSCLQQPSKYSYNFITFVSNIYLPEGSVDLFTMHGPLWDDSVVNYEMGLINVDASPGVRAADLSCFDMRPSNNICVISLICSLQGPQVVELELKMSLIQHQQFAGSAVARLVVIVSQYEF